MTDHRTRRRLAREAVMQALFQLEYNPDVGDVATADFLAERLQQKGLIDFAASLLEGVRRHRDELDRSIEENATNWRLSRMAAVDRNALRLAAYELLYTDTPANVVINEAIEICRRFSDKNSPAFVNGILDRVARNASANPVGEAAKDSIETHDAE